MYTSWAKFLTKFHRNSTDRSLKNKELIPLDKGSVFTTLQEIQTKGWLTKKNFDLQTGNHF